MIQTTKMTLAGLGIELQVAQGYLPYAADFFVHIIGAELVESTNTMAQLVYGLSPIMLYTTHVVEFEYTNCMSILHRCNPETKIEAIRTRLSGWGFAEGNEFHITQHDGVDGYDVFINVIPCVIRLVE